jgi:L-lysine 6-transaminase
MTTVTEISDRTVSAKEVHATLGKTMLADGFEFVLDAEKSGGSYIWDSLTDRKYLDFFTFFASGAIGMNHPALTTPEFVNKLGRVGVHKPSNSDIYTVEFAEFVDTFSRLAMPSFMKYVFFVDGGALAVENALKAAFDWKIQKNFAKGIKEERSMQVIHFRHAFHGRSGYTLSVTNTDPAKTKYFPKFPWPRIHNPAVRFPLNEENLKQVKNEEGIALEEIRKTIAEKGDDIACILIEPIQAEGGDNHFRVEFMQELRKICDENEIMLIFDEVQTGIGITGKMWACEHTVQPDMIAFGKKTHVCGFMSSGRIDDIPNNVFRASSRINSTFGGNIVDMVRFKRILEVIEEEKLVDNAAEVGAHLLRHLQALEQEFPGQVSNARGLGLFCAIDVENGEKRSALMKSAFEKGVVLIGCGAATVRFRPPLNISKSEIDEGIGIIRESLQELSKGS